MYFFHGLQMDQNCFQFGLRGDVGTNYESVVQESENIHTYEEVIEVIIPKDGDMRVRG